MVSRSCGFGPLSMKSCGFVELCENFLKAKGVFGWMVRKGEWIEI